MTYPDGSYNAYNEKDEVGYSMNGAVCGFFGPPWDHWRAGSLVFFGFLFSLKIASMDFFVCIIAILCDRGHALFAIVLLDFVLAD